MALVVYLPFMESNNGFLEESTFYFIGISIILYTLNATELLFLKKTDSVIVKKTDIIIIILFIYSFLNSNKEPLSLFNLKIACIIVIYFSIRNISRNNLILVFAAIIVSGVIQAILGNLQLYGICSSNHSAFNITGSFNNPGPFAGYLSISLLLSAILRLETISRPCTNIPQNKILILLLSFAVFSIIIVLPATMSRAAWLSGLIPLLIYFISRNQIIKKLPKTILKFSIPVFLNLMFAGIYFLKKDSADGRLLIWKICGGMIKEKPIFGHGIGGFESSYMDFQASFFERNPNFPSAQLADDISYPFNEYIHILSELGILGLLLIAVSIYLVLPRRKNTDSALCKTSRAALVSILIFAFFSYPTKILSILNLTIILYASCVNRNIRNGGSELFAFQIRSKISKFISIVIFITIPIITYQPIKEIQKSYFYWDEAYSLYKIEAYNTAIESYNLAYKQLRTNGEFLIMYGKALELSKNYSMAIQVFNEAEKYKTNNILYIALGNCYKQQKNYEDAEKAYLKAHHMVPNRFYPLYLLSKLHFDSKNYLKTIEIGELILKKNIKVYTKAIDEMKAEIQTILQESYKHI